MEASQMSVITLEGVVENGRIKLNTSVLLPENTKVYVVIPGTDIEPEAPVYDIRLDERVVHIYSPHLAPPSSASDLKLEIIGEASDDGL
jgi:hypothetical protein